MTQREWWYERTRMPSFVVGVSLGILAVGVVLGAIVAHTLPQTEDVSLIRHLAESGRPASALVPYFEHLRQHNDQPYDAFDLLPPIAKAMPERQRGADAGAQPLSPEGFARAVDEDKIVPAIAIPLKALFDAIHHDRRNGGSELPALAARHVEYAAYALGVFFEDAENWHEAAGWYEKEADAFKTSEARWATLHFYLRAQDRAKVDELKVRPEYQSLLTLHARFEIAALDRDFPTVLALTIPKTFYHVPPMILALGIASGLVWLLFSLQCAHYLSAGWRQGWRALLAVLLGVVSIPLTVLTIALEEGMLHLAEQHDAVGGLAYFVVGVGLREEFWKLALCAPILWLCRHRGKLEILILASIVGLGFAVEENLYYFRDYGILVAPARFLTANFFHMAATGYLGLSLFEVFRGELAGDQLAKRFAIVVALHGGYDALLSVPALKEYGYFSTGCYVYLCYLYFHELRRLRPVSKEPVSLTANFAFGLSVVLAGTFIYLCRHVSVASALQILGESGLELAALVYMFAQELPESITNSLE